ncbi:MAG: hypothetical protein Q7T50_08050 [Candidatus Magasanikbacteria bacterium]|nr:hypothetical protein [Candidatus Magasanikbacteria bacterium]
MKKSSIIVKCILVLSVICFSGFTAEAKIIELKKGQSVEIGDGLIPVTMTYKGTFGIKNDSYQLNFNKSKMNLTCQLTGVEISTTIEGNPPSKVTMVVNKFSGNKIILNLLSCEPIMCYRPGVFVRSVSFGGGK